MNTLARLFSALVLTLSLAGCADNDEAPTAPSAAASASDSVVASHVDVVRRRITACNARDWNAWEALHTADAVRTAPELPAPLQGSGAMRAALEELVTTFPDYHLELVDAFGSGDRLVARIHTRATMLGPMQLGDWQVPATGRAFEQDWVAVLRFQGEQIASIDEFYDNYATMVQLGLAEAP